MGTRHPSPPPPLPHLSVLLLPMLETPHCFATAPFLPSHSCFSWVSAPCSFSWSQFQPAAAFQQFPVIPLGKYPQHYTVQLLVSHVFSDNILANLLSLWSCPYLLL